MRILRPEHGRVPRLHAEDRSLVGVRELGEVYRCVVGLGDFQPGRLGYFHQFVPGHDHLHVDEFAVRLEKPLRPRLCPVGHLHDIGAARQFLAVRRTAGHSHNPRVNRGASGQGLTGIDERGGEFREARALTAHGGEGSENGHAVN